MEQKDVKPVFAPVVVETAPPPLPEPVPAAVIEAPPIIEISIGAATVRVRGAVDAKALGAVLKALKVFVTLEFCRRPVPRAVASPAPSRALLLEPSIASPSSATPASSAGKPPS